MKNAVPKSKYAVACFFCGTGRISIQKKDTIQVEGGSRIPAGITRAMCTDCCREKGTAAWRAR